jgi:hypothetical protein
MSKHASGTFEVKLGLLEPYNKSAEAGLGRMSLDKKFHGDLEGLSQGEMLSGGMPEKGSAGYVAMERVTGTLDGRAGSFALQHSGTMSAGAHQLSVIVVPGSGTGALTDISGTMQIIIASGKHSYEFDYSLPDVA